MNEEQDPLAGILNEQQAAPQGPQPLSDVNRLIIQNIFDSNPKKKAAFIKQLGYEINPEDDNQYRPVGSTGGYAEIDPGVSAYFKSGGLKELVKDFGDVAWAALVDTPMIAAGAAPGATAGLGAGAVTGIPPIAAATSVLGGITGGSFGAAASEAFKQGAADLLLDENIPNDKKAMALQAFIGGVSGPIFKGGRAIKAEVAQQIVKSRQKAIINAASSSGGGLTPEILEKAAKNPEIFSREAVKGATDRLKGTYKELFGIESPLTIDSPDRLRGGAFGKALDPLNKLANTEVENLALNPNASFDVSELKAPIEAVASRLANKFDRSADEEAALKYLKQKYNFLDSKVAAKEGEKAVVDDFGNQAAAKKINFKEAREFLNVLQDDAFNREIPGSSYLRQVIGGNRDQNQIRALLDQKAEAVGSSLPSINKRRSELLNVYNAAQESLTPQNVTAAFMGNDSIKKSAIRDVFGAMDQTLGTNYSQSFETGAMQKAVEDMYANPKAFGSGRVVGEALKGAGTGGLTGAGAGAAAGAITGVGAGPGAVIGGVGGAIAGASRAAALATPERALSTIASQSDKIDELGALLKAPMSTPLTPAEAIQAQALSPSAGQLMPADKPEQKKPTNVDPLSDIFGE